MCKLLIISALSSSRRQKRVLNSNHYFANVINAKGLNNIASSNPSCFVVEGSTVNNQGLKDAIFEFAKGAGSDMGVCV